MKTQEKIIIYQVFTRLFGNAPGRKRPETSIWSCVRTTG